MRARDVAALWLMRARSRLGLWTAVPRRGASWARRATAYHLVVLRSQIRQWGSSYRMLLARHHLRRSPAAALGSVRRLAGALVCALTRILRGIAQLPVAVVEGFQGRRARHEARQARRTARRELRAHQRRQRQAADELAASHARLARARAGVARPVGGRHRQSRPGTGPLPTAVLARLRRAARPRIGLATPKISLPPAARRSVVAAALALGIAVPAYGLAVVVSAGLFSDDALSTRDLIRDAGASGPAVAGSGPAEGGAGSGTAAPAGAGADGVGSAANPGDASSPPAVAGQPTASSALEAAVQSLLAGEPIAGTAAGSAVGEALVPAMRPSTDPVRPGWIPPSAFTEALPVLPMPAVVQGAPSQHSTMTVTTAADRRSERTLEQRRQDRERDQRRQAERAAQRLDEDYGK